MENKKNILILGGDSFIARHFVRKYNQDYNIRTISRVQTGYRNELVCEDLFAVSKNEFTDINIVINFAAIVHQKKEIPDSIYFRVNRDLAIDFAAKAKKNKVSQFIQMSTIAVYDPVENIERNSPEVPVTPYGKSKLEADKSLLLLTENNFKITILRPSMVYGGGNAPGNMMRLISLVDKKLPLPFKNITNKRDFIHVDNLISCIDIAIKKEITGVNLLCDGVAISVSDLIETIGRALHIKLRVFRVPGFLISMLKKFHPGLFEKLYGSLQISNLDITEKFGIIPKDRYFEGIEEMANYFLKSKKGN